mmetsp:Transcript_5565/g.11311  ORF Transcript_5565/g.11311 Transcript_5565/m.11311 type:complete len:285 (+) Transcript_5565:77-931(+)
MGVLDRTTDFREILQIVSAKGGAPELSSNNDSVPQAQSELNAWSAEIANGIHQASLKVQELRRLARKKNIFEDRTPEVQELSYTMKQELDVLTRKMEVFEQKAKGMGANRNYQIHAANMAETLKMRLFQVSKDLQGALQDHMSASEQRADRRSLYSARQSTPANVSALSQPPMFGDPDDPEAGAVQAVAIQRAQSLGRAKVVQSIQRTIGEVAQTVQKMAVMVSAQEESIRRIEQDTEDALTSLDSAQVALLEHLRQLASNRGLILKVFLILILFAVFFVVFLA